MNTTPDADLAEAIPTLIAEEPIMKFFSFGHLPEGLLRDTSRLFANAAWTVCRTLPRSAERATALRKLLEGKDAAVRAALP